MNKIPLKLYEILGFSLSHYKLKKNTICIINNYNSIDFYKKNIFTNLCIEYLQEINNKNDLKYVNKFNLGIEFYSNKISSDLKNIIKNYDEYNSIIFEGTDEEIYNQKISLLKGCYLRRGKNLNIIFYFLEGYTANYILKIMKDISQNILNYKIIDSEKEGGGCNIKMNDDGELLSKLFDSKN